ncbi:hypothetical protein [Halosegnis marinus]|uniref:DUF8156 domain-containing protein n=1 Tax=Halosegnis marinus TaxID=3034023 RepID=A0ABD5ZT67_9EURY|nr:hypothetical protein [Halosegnis sp. DT85]
MGRTSPTYRRFLEGRRDQWGDYRRALRHDATQDFDSVFAYAEQYADAAGYLNRSDPTTALLLSMVIGLEAERRQLESRVAKLEETEETDATLDG